MSLEIELDRPNLTYSPREKVSGVIKITSGGKMSHTGIRILVEGG